MAETEAKTDKNTLVIVLLMVVAVLGYKLWEDGQKTPERIPTFEKRIESKDANLWEGGYYFHAGKIDPKLLQAVYQPQQGQPQQVQYEPEDENIRAMERANRQWEEYCRRNPEPQQIW